MCLAWRVLGCLGLSAYSIETVKFHQPELLENCKMSFAFNMINQLSRISVRCFPGFGKMFDEITRFQLEEDLLGFAQGW